MIERVAFEAWVSAQRVRTGEVKGESDSNDYDAFVERARKRRRQRKQLSTEKSGS